ncbi:MAG: polysaccharide deacetylase family protein [Hyphomicrobiales bacterium]
MRNSLHSHWQLDKIMLRKALLKYGLVTFASSGLANVIEPLTGGRGAILMLHRVRPKPSRAFQPNGHLEITPRFLDSALRGLKNLDVDFIHLDEVPERLAVSTGKRFVVVTLDDASLDNLTEALPVFKKHNCPFTIYASAGFADRTALPWWLVLEEVLAKRGIVDARPIGGDNAEVVGSLQQKRRAFPKLAEQFRAVFEQEKQTRIHEFADIHGLNVQKLMNDNFMNWQQLREIHKSELTNIGGHTVNHPMLARLRPEEIEAEIVNGAIRQQEMLGYYPKHFAYPYGNEAAADKLVFKVVQSLGFETAVTTRGGVLQGKGRESLVALPRLSLNGHFQDVRALRALMSGAPFVAKVGARERLHTFIAAFLGRGAASTKQ